MTVSERRFDDFVAQLQTIDDEAEAARYAEQYLTLYPGSFPIVEDDIAHFVYRASPDRVVGVSGEWNGWDARKALMTPIGGGLLHYQREFEADARLDYMFVEVRVEDVQAWLSYTRPQDQLSLHWRLDPLNARYGESGFGAKSELAMPDYQRPTLTLAQPGVQRGTLHKKTIHSDILQQERSYTVYLPYGYHETSEADEVDKVDEAYASVYFHDGGDYLTMGYAPTILDNLIQNGHIPPMVAVFVPPVAREDEYNCNDQFVQFFCDELVPEMHRTYRLSNDASLRGIIGPSMGGIISLYMGQQRPEIFGRVGAQSSVIKTINGLEKFDARLAFAVEPRLTLKLYLVIGSYEICFGVDSHGKCRDLLTPVQEFEEVVERSGYTYRYREDHQAHSWSLWRDSLVDALTYLFAPHS